MADTNTNMPGDRAIGMDASITRRDFLGATLLASGASLLNGWTPAEFLAMGDGAGPRTKKTIGRVTEASESTAARTATPTR